MVKDAEAHAEDDRKARELVDARNQSDSMVHSVRKSLTEHGDKLNPDDRARIETALKETEEAMKSDDKAVIEAKTQALTQAAQKIAEQVYKEQQAAQAAQQSAAGQQGPAGSAAAANREEDDSNVVDAEFEEVKDKKSLSPRPAGSEVRAESFGR
jgi:molecular chaperone DnaK